MADLVDRIRGKPDLGRPKIPVSQLYGALVLVSEGEMTEAEAKQDFDLQGDELTQANAILAVLDARTTAIGKIRYAMKFFSVSAILEQGETEDTIYNNPDGTINKTRVEAALEI